MHKTKKEIIIIYSGRYPSEKAHSFFVSKVCESFAGLSMNVRLVTSKRVLNTNLDPFSYFGIRKNFLVKRMAIIDLFPYLFIPKKASYYIAQISFSIFCFIYISFNTKKNDIIYSNEFSSLFLLIFLKRKIYYEMHDFPENKKKFYNYFFKKINGIVVTNKWKYDKLLKDFSLPADKLLYVPNAIDLKDFENEVNREELRNKYKVPNNKKVIAYVGKYTTMGVKKGVDELIEVVGEIKKQDDNVFLLIVGLNSDEMDEVQTVLIRNGLKSEDFMLVTHVPHAEVVFYLKLSDMLVMNYPLTDHFAYYMSPMKMFEYMASGVPAIASRLPSITEIMNENNSLLVPANSQTGLKNAIIKLMNDQNFGDAIAKQARIDVGKYTWDERAQKIINFIK